jgi:hypothetical protein
MQTQLNEARESFDDHPTLEVLTDKEAIVYLISEKMFAEGAAEVRAYKEKHGEVNSTSDELAHSVEKIRTGSIISQLIEEVATWRQCGVNQPESIQGTTWSTRGEQFLQAMGDSDE